MSASYATAHVQGNLGRDPEIKYTPKGTALCDFSLAVSEKYTTEGGEKREETHWISCIAWGRTAELLGEYCRKGSSVYVTGRLKVDEWDDKETGKKRTKMVVNVDRMLFNQTKREGEGGEQRREQSAPATGRRPATPPRPPRDPDLDALADDIPF